MLACHQGLCTSGDNIPQNCSGHSRHTDGLKLENISNCGRTSPPLLLLWHLEATYVRCAPVRTPRHSFNQQPQQKQRLQKSPAKPPMVSVIRMMSWGEDQRLQPFCSSRIYHRTRSSNTSNSLSSNNNGINNNSCKIPGSKATTAPTSAKTTTVPAVAKATTTTTATIATARDTIGIWYGDGSNVSPRPSSLKLGR